MMNQGSIFDEGTFEFDILKSDDGKTADSVEESSSISSVADVLPASPFSSEMVNLDALLQMDMPFGDDVEKSVGNEMSTESDSKNLSDEADKAPEAVDEVVNVVSTEKVEEFHTDISDIDAFESAPNRGNVALDGWDRALVRFGGLVFLAYVVIDLHLIESRLLGLFAVSLIQSLGVEPVYVIPKHTTDTTSSSIRCS